MIATQKTSNGVAYVEHKTTAWAIYNRNVKGRFVGTLGGNLFFRLGSGDNPSIFVWDKSEHREIEVTLDTLYSACGK